ncbi:hypothetical protein DFH06DRAFT_1213129 [Mycena polygramma]|nr:hypothetical protein DFH06DRAFT_1213129 [Mycena polygramma]
MWLRCAGARRAAALREWVEFAARSGVSCSANRCVRDMDGCGRMRSRCAWSIVRTSTLGVRVVNLVRAAALGCYQRANPGLQFARCACPGAVRADSDLRATGERGAGRRWCRSSDSSPGGAVRVTVCPRAAVSQAWWSGGVCYDFCVGVLDPLDAPRHPCVQLPPRTLPGRRRRRCQCQGAARFLFPCHARDRRTRQPEALRYSTGVHVRSG